MDNKKGQKRERNIFTGKCIRGKEQKWSERCAKKAIAKLVRIKWVL